jgi:hypothetical protein
VGQPVQVQVLLSAPSLLRKIEDSCVLDTVLPQEWPESAATNVKFPKRIKHRGKVLAVSYGKSKSHGYRVAWQVAGQRRMQGFKTASERPVASANP